MKLMTVRALLGALALSVCVSGLAAAQDPLPDSVATPYSAYSEAIEAQDYDRARRYARKAWKAAEEARFDASTTAILADNYAQLAQAAEEHDKAAEAYSAAADLFVKGGGEPLTAAEIHLLASASALRAEDFSMAARQADKAADMAEAVEGGGKRAANVRFSGRALHAHSLWRSNRIRPAVARAREAMEIAETTDLTHNPHYGSMAFYLGALASMESDFPEAAFRLTQAMVTTEGEVEGMRHWADYARGKLNDRQRAELFERIAEAGLVMPPPPEEEWEEEGASGDAPDGVRVDARPVRRPVPSYPAAAAANGAEGVTVISYTVDERGRTDDIEVVFSIPYSIFGEAAVEAVERWRFEPATLDGVPVRREGMVIQFPFIMMD